MPRHPVLDHKIKWNLKKRKVCFACKRKPGNQCVGVTNFGCVRCQEPCHVHCLAEHSICEEEPVKNGDGKPAVAEDSNIPGNVAAEAVSRQRMGIPQTLKSVTDTAVYCEQVPVCVCFFSPHTFKFIWTWTCEHCQSTRSFCCVWYCWSPDSSFPSQNCLWHPLYHSLVVSIIPPGQKSACGYQQFCFPFFFSYVWCSTGLSAGTCAVCFVYYTTFRHSKSFTDSVNHQLFADNTQLQKSTPPSDM